MRTRAPAPAGRPRCRWASCSTPSPRPPVAEALDRVVVRHPLQPFDARNFTPGALGAPGPFSFDRVELAGSPGRRGREGAACRRSCPARSRRRRRPTVALDDLVAFLEHPVKQFLRQRVGLPISDGDDDAADALPVALDALQRWAVGDRLLRDRLAGVDLERCRAAEWRRGELPPGALGNAVLAELLDDVEELVAASARLPRTGASRGRATSTWRCRTAPGSSARCRASTATWRCGSSSASSAPSTGCGRGRGWWRSRAAQPGPAVAGGDGRARRRAAGSPWRAPGRWTPTGPAACSPTSWRCTGRGCARRCPCRRTPRWPTPARSTGSGDRRRRARRGHPHLVRGPLPRTRRGPVRAGVRGERAAPSCSPRARSASSPCACGARSWKPRRCDDRLLDGSTAPTPSPSTSAARCPPAPPCWRPAPAPARRSRSPRSPRATSPRAHARLPELLLVTFGREATQELRERVRERLVSRRAGAARPRPPPRAGADTVLALLADAPDDEVALRRRRLAAALAEFDAATIATTHQFCGQMLTGLGVAGDAEPDAVFVESVDDLVAEVVDDFYVRKFAARDAGTPAFDRAEALRAGPPRGRRPAGPAGARRRRAPAARAQVRFAFATAVRARGRAAQAAPRPAHLRRPGHPARRRAGRPGPRRRGAAARPLPGGARRRVPGHRPGAVGDPAATSHGHLPLVLIGDPKQAIYAFRGADVVSYLDAVEHADAHATLGRNWRSDAGAARARWTGVRPAPRSATRGSSCATVESAHPVPRLAGAPVDTPLRIRVVRRDGLACSSRGHALTPDARGARRAGRRRGRRGPAREPGDGRTARPLRPGDVAVLVRPTTRARCCATRWPPSACRPCCRARRACSARPRRAEWLILLRALEQPRPIRIRAAALTCFLGRTVAELCGGRRGDALLDELGATAAPLGRACCTGAGSRRCSRR